MADEQQDTTAQKSAKTKDIAVELVQFLIVDDQPFLRHIISKCLEAHKVSRVSFARHGGEALHLLKTLFPTVQDTSPVGLIEARPNIAGDMYTESADFRAAPAYCVITDFNMPEANGLQLLKAIRCGETRIPRDTPVILLTGLDDDFVISAAQQLDVSVLLHKPVPRDVLWEKIQSALKLDSPAKDARIYAAVEISDDAG